MRPRCRDHTVSNFVTTVLLNSNVCLIELQHFCYKMRWRYYCEIVVPKSSNHSASLAWRAADNDIPVAAKITEIEVYEKLR